MNLNLLATASVYLLCFSVFTERCRDHFFCERCPERCQLKKTIPQYTVEDRSDDFNRFFNEDSEYISSAAPSFWELSYNTENSCNVTIKGMRQYDLNLADVVSVFLKQRGEYIKLVIKTEKDKVKVEQTNNGDESPESIPEVSKTDIVVIDFPLYARQMVIQVARAFEHAVSLCAGKEMLQH